MSNWIWPREERLARAKKFQDDARDQYEASLACIQAGRLKAAAHFQEEAAILYERAGNVVIGLLKKDTPGHGST